MDIPNMTDADKGVDSSLGVFSSKHGCDGDSSKIVRKRENTRTTGSGYVRKKSENLS